VSEEERVEDRDEGRGRKGVSYDGGRFPYDELNG
jgi:hypothetical protein